jgi:hypothetical protein
MWVSHGSLEAWGLTTAKEIVDIGCRVQTSHMNLCSGYPTRPFVHSWDFPYVVFFFIHLHFHNRSSILKNNRWHNRWHHVLMLFEGCSGLKSGWFNCHRVNTNQYIPPCRKCCRSNRTQGKLNWHGNIRHIQGITWLHNRCEVWMHGGGCTMSKRRSRNWKGITNMFYKT